jgi:hypothetical protein
MCFALPSGRNTSKSLTGKPNAVLELARLWAPDGHEPNLLTRALSAAVRKIRTEFPQYEILVAYSDPAAGHNGGVYKAANWIQIGETDGRQRLNGYQSRKHGQPKARYAFGLTRAARQHLTHQRAS